jgi:ATP-dependent Lhr-like helicase
MTLRKARATSVGEAGKKSKAKEKSPRSSRAPRSAGTTGSKAAKVSTNGRVRAPISKKASKQPPTSAKPLLLEPSAPLDIIEQWFAARGWEPWPFQRETWNAYIEGRSGLIQVPTGAGKTYAAYLGPLGELVAYHRNISQPGHTLRILYITPLRAVSRDIELALRAPLHDLAPGLLIESRTGDTKQSTRTKQRDRLPEVLVTTPESLCLLLTHAEARERFAGLTCVIVDEWHELLSSKRGTQVELCLARLRTFAPAMRTWGMSATIANGEEAARALVGAAEQPLVVRAPMKREVIVDSVLPTDMRRLPLAGHLGLHMLPDVIAALDPAVPTLVFTNTRSQSERWYNAILAVKPEWADRLALHHGSIDRAAREAVEAGLKSGSLTIVVATSSLDLGVDFAPVERVMQIGSPKGIGRLMQRAGRASHRPMTPCRVTCVPTHGLELFEIDAARNAVQRGDIEPRLPIAKPLDVLAQHLVTCALGGGFVREEIFEEVRQAWSYRDLTWQEFEWALALVENGGGTLRAYPDYHRIAPVEGRYVITGKRIAQMHRLNVGTIVSDTTIDLRYLSGKVLGRIEEHFIAHLRPGEKFVFAGKTVSFEFMKDLAAYVKPASGHTNNTPIWGGTRLPISESLAHAIRDAMHHCDEPGATLSPELLAAKGIVAAQKSISRIPHRDEVLIEHCNSRDGRHCFIFPFDGRLVHAGLAAILSLRLARKQSGTFSIAVNDYGLELLSSAEYPFESLLTPDLFAPDRVVDDALESMNLSELAKLQFREIARVSGLVMQTYPGVHKTAKQSQANAGLLFDVLSEFDPTNLLLHQSRREVLDRHFEQSRLARCLTRLKGAVHVHMNAARFTPLSFPLVIERQAAKLSTQSIVERIEAMRLEWNM